ncbi:efflux RND transporter periplasmic adaptor subunit [Peredibacter sp. HCB2-198]|uniref:efflux RND transporter periplasmic adaptor subunit n=1 Tax=Peredibacter sp. HCB2-198 TaxID=3383025 RepID=UPI0038B4FA51
MAKLEKKNTDPVSAYANIPDTYQETYAETPKKMLQLHDLPESAKLITRLVVVFFLFMMVFLIAIPWQQTSDGSGKVMAYLPQDRVQNIHATVTGRIKKWFVKEGSFVKQGDPVMELVDIDPNYMARLKVEFEAAKSQYEAAQAVVKTAKFDYDRQTDLYNKGISSRKDMEQAIIAYKTAQSEEAQALANFTQMQSRFSRQESQLVLAPTDGTIVRLLVGTSSVVVNQGQVVAIFVPKSSQLSAHIFIRGNDLPLVYEGRKVRLQFEGWPAIQFSGWPSVAVGTFGGVVSFVDQTATPEGLFRVIVLPEKNEKWPESRFIRQGTRVNGWILLNNVALGYELWRQFNGFPPSLDAAPSALETSTQEIPE